MDWGLPALSVRGAQPRLRSWRWRCCSLWVFIFQGTHYLLGILFHLQHPISSWNALFLEVQGHFCISALLLLLSVSLPVLLVFFGEQGLCFIFQKWRRDWISVVLWSFQLHTGFHSHSSNVLLYHPPWAVPRILLCLSGFSRGEVERWVVSDIELLRPFSCPKEQQHWVKSSRIKLFSQQLPGGMEGSRMILWICFSAPLTKGHWLGSCLDENCPI